ncbi:MAG: hypothetical protein JWP44_4881 [Mucilaginibacter sp.]|jgi:hypothetical protein|nr:hypothetical protein [Mucilaginibacter sp.]
MSLAELGRRADAVVPYMDEAIHSIHLEHTAVYEPSIHLKFLCARALVFEVEYLVGYLSIQYCMVQWVSAVLGGCGPCGKRNT